jgi:hypothetical protein
MKIVFRCLDKIMQIEVVSSKGMKGIFSNEYIGIELLNDI